MPHIYREIYNAEPQDDFHKSMNLIAMKIIPVLLSSERLRESTILPCSLDDLTTIVTSWLSLILPATPFSLVVIVVC